MTKNKVIKLCQEEKIKFHLQFSDLDKIVKSVEISVIQLVVDALDNEKWFDYCLQVSISIS